VWEVKGEIPEAVRGAILAHLEKHCDFAFSDGDCSLTGEQLAFYADTFLCQLDLPAGCTLKIRRKRQELPIPVRFYFLYKPAIDGDVLVPLSGREGDCVLAKRWLGLILDDDAKRLSYARFYLAFARTKRPPQFANIPRSVHDLRFARGITEPRIWGVYGSLWRFGVNDKELAVRARFERRGSFWFSRWRAHLPMQGENELHDIDLHIWELDGHVTFHPSAVIYRDPALLAEPQGLPGRISRPRYIRWHETLLALYRNFQAGINQAFYLTATTLFVLATAVCVFFPLEIYGWSFVREWLDATSAAIGLGSWTAWLRIACFTWIGYFALTTLVILDAATVRNSLLALSERFKGSRLDSFLFWLVRRERRIENRRGLLRRLGVAARRLVAWTIYLVCVFTSLQVSYRPQIVEDAKALGDVWQVFAEQALLYVPVVFYYVGRESLDPAKLALVTPWILILLQLSMGLLVIRRIHRFWASTAAANASN
jgi:hypothetical protein